MGDTDNTVVAISKEINTNTIKPAVDIRRWGIMTHTDKVEKKLICWKVRIVFSVFEHF